MNTEILMQYMTYALIAIGVLAFLVSIITQVIKEMPGLKDIQTNAVALVIALILCPLAVVILCIYLQIAIMWLLHRRIRDRGIYRLPGRHGRLGEGR